MLDHATVAPEIKTEHALHKMARIWNEVTALPVSALVELVRDRDPEGPPPTDEEKLRTQIANRHLHDNLEGLLARVPTLEIARYGLQASDFRPNTHVVNKLLIWLVSSMPASEPLLKNQKLLTLWLISGRKSAYLSGLEFLADSGCLKRRPALDQTLTNYLQHQAKPSAPTWLIEELCAIAKFQHEGTVDRRARIPWPKDPEGALYFFFSAFDAAAVEIFGDVRADSIEEATQRIKQRGMFTYALAVYDPLSRQIAPIWVDPLKDLQVHIGDEVFSAEQFEARVFTQETALRYRAGHKPSSSDQLTDWLASKVPNGLELLVG